MNPVLKNMMWDLFAPTLGCMAIADWYYDKLPGYWAFVVCLLAAVYFWESTLRSILINYYHLQRKQ